MPLSNPFRRQTERPTLRERAASLRASLRPAPAGPTVLPVPGSDAAKAAWQAACHEHSVRTAPLHDCPELMSPTGDVWTKRTLAEALETGRIAVNEYAHLYPLASERELRFDQIGHELNTAPLFALAFADEYRERAAEPRAAVSESDTLPAAIFNGWAAWGATTGFGVDASAEELAAWERASEHRDRLLYAAMALPATPENITAKALACAWMEWVSTERPGQPREAYGPADRLVYDIHATIMQRGSQETASQPAPITFDFGLDAHIAELAAEFCEAYAANIKADREHMAGRMSEAEWLPHYRRTAELMDRLEATEPKTVLGMALKCLGPIGAAGYNALADEDEVQADAWDRVGTQFANAVLRGDLAPLPAAGWHASPVDLIAAAGLSVETLPVSDLCSMLDAAEILSDVAAAITCQPRQMTRGNFNGAGRLIESTAFALHRAIDVVARELRRRTPGDASDKAERLAALARLTIHNDDDAEIAALARELLAMVEP